MSNDQMLLTPIKTMARENGEAISSDYVSPFRVDKAYFIRTATMNWTGRIVSIEGHFATLTEAAWIADCGRYNEAVLSDKNFSEIEPVEQNVLLNLDSVIDAVEITFKLPRSVK